MDQKRIKLLRPKERMIEELRSSLIKDLSFKGVQGKKSNSSSSKDQDKKRDSIKSYIEFLKISQFLSIGNSEISSSFFIFMDQKETNSRDQGLIPSSIFHSGLNFILRILSPIMFSGSERRKRVKRGRREPGE